MVPELILGGLSYGPRHRRQGPGAFEDQVFPWPQLFTGINKSRNQQRTFYITSMHRYNIWALGVHIIIEVLG